MLRIFKDELLNPKNFVVTLGQRPSNEKMIFRGVFLPALIGRRETGAFC